MGEDTEYRPLRLTLCTTRSLISRGTRAQPHPAPGVEYIRPALPSEGNFELCPAGTLKEIVPVREIECEAVRVSGLSLKQPELLYSSRRRTGKPLALLSASPPIPVVLEAPPVGGELSSRFPQDAANVLRLRRDPLHHRSVLWCRDQRFENLTRLLPQATGHCSRLRGCMPCGRKRGGRQSRRLPASLRQIRGRRVPYPQADHPGARRIQLKPV